MQRKPIEKASIQNTPKICSFVVLSYLVLAINVVTAAC